MKKVFKDYKEMCTVITDEVLDLIIEKPNCIITIAGGDTPKGVFEELSKKLTEKKIDYSNVTFVSLDEWVGLGIDDIGSCKETLCTQFFDKLELEENQIVFFDGLSNDLQTECTTMTEFIEKSGGIDIMILGVGMNGHLGFNEPEYDIKDCAVVELADKTKEVMKKYFNNKELPLEYGITLGYNQILSAKKIIVMANGKHKKEIINQIINSEPTLKIPATMIKKHKHAMLYIDEEANNENYKEE